MQGERGIIGSLPEIFEFDHGSSSGNAIVDHQIRWNIMPNPAENRLEDFMVSPSQISNAQINSIDQERQNLSGWGLGETSSSGTPNEASREEQKPENSRSTSASNSASAGPRLEERGYEPANNLSLDNVNSQFVQTSNSIAVPQNFNLNAGFVGHQATASASDTNRPSSKRKAVEGHIGQPSMSERPDFFLCPENSPWSGVPAHYEAGTSLSTSAPLEQVNPRLGLGLRRLASDSIPDSSLARRPEASQRNLRLRISHSNQDSSPPPLFTTANPSRRSRPLPTDHFFGFRSSPVLDGATSQIPHVPLPVPSLPQNVQPFRWNESSSSRNQPNGSSSSSMGNREEGNSRSASRRNLLEHSVFAPTTELRTSVRNPTGRNSTGGNASNGVHPLLAPTRASHPNPPSRSSRRLAEYVRRSVFFSANGDSVGQSSSHPLPSGPPGLSEVPITSLGVPNQGHNRSYPRSASWMERQGDGALGFSHPLRAFGAGEGRSRLLVTEIRNVLDLMRRGEGMRFEDFMILDQSVLFGVPEIHDRHRDMRLDVDNMSYEELLALEERIGNVNTGLSAETISNKLKQRAYSASAQTSDVEAEPCSVCQEEYKDGESMGTLDCGHDYHRKCIEQWLMLKNWCPICKTTGLAT